MIRTLAPLVILALAMWAGPVASQTKPGPKPAAKPASTLDRCLAKPTGQTTYGMVECLGIEIQAQDARLNRAYQAALVRLERPRQKSALQKAQRAWIAFRDADCASYLDEDWGTMARIEAQQCVLDRTVERADELQRFREAY